jgi:thermostable 8-oxoguanine DNA glycosylase
LIKSLFKNNITQFKYFLNHIQDYNHALIFTFCMYTANKYLMNQREIQAFIIHDELYHLQKSLHLTVQELSCFAQLYFHDSAQMIIMRLTQSFALHESLLRQLNEMIQAYENLFIDMYKSA